MFNRIAQSFDLFFRRVTPDPFVIAMGLTVVVFLLGSSLTSSSVETMVGLWGDGFWNLKEFTLQMVMILVTGHILADSPLVRSLLRKCASLIKTPGQGVIITTLVSMLASWMNWGFGLIVAALMAVEVARAVPSINYRLLVASAYSGFIVWHGGLAGSIPLLLATPGNFFESIAGGPVPATATIFSSMNFFIIFSLVLTIPLVNGLMGVEDNTTTKLIPPKPEPLKLRKVKKKNFVDWIESSRLPLLVLAAVFFFYLYLSYRNNELRFELDRLNFVFLALGMASHRSPREFLRSVYGACQRVGPIILQYPFYAGIMGILVGSGLAEALFKPVTYFANETTFPLFAFLSAGFFNLFIPSGGGQWAVQGPIIVPAAEAIGVSLPSAAMAVAWGDAWTNLLQPFWALPLLGITRLRLRDIMGYCVAILIVSGFVISIALMVRS